MADRRSSPATKTRFEPLTRAIGAVSLAASRHAGLMLLFILVVTAGLGFGTTKLTTNVDVADVLPRGDYNTTAAHELTKQFKSAFTQQVTLQFHVDDAGDRWAKDNAAKIPLRRTTANARNITDEVYVRAINQAVQKMHEYDPYVCCSIAVSDLYRLINWTVAGGTSSQNTVGDASYALPDPSLKGELDYAEVDRLTQTAILSAVDALSSPGWTGTAVLLTPPAQLDVPMAEIGRRAIAARDAYMVWATEHPEEAYQVFTGDNYPRLTVELPVANAHSSELTKQDFSRLLPLIAGFLLAMLFLAFRNVGAVLISFSSLAIGVLWTYGLEGYLGIALNPLNLTLMPLIMGVGIDYSIHIVNEFLEHKSHGMDNPTAFREVGRRAGLALFVGTATTILGLMVMVASPSVLIAEFGLLAAVAMATIYVLALTYIPAALTLWPTTHKMGASFRSSGLIAGTARLVTKGRMFVLVAVVVLSIMGTVASLRLYNEPFGDPGRNYLHEDPVRKEHETGLRWFYETKEPDVKANVLVFEGDLTNPQAHQYMRSIERELKKQPRVISDTLRTIPFLMETWLTVKGGGVGAVEYLASQRAGAPPYPASAEAIRNEFNQLYAAPIKELGSIFTNGPQGNYHLGVMTFSVRAATYAEAEQVWKQVWSAVGNASKDKPADIKVAMVGNTATNYLFVAKEVPWVLYMGTIATLGLMLIVIPFFRSVRAVLTVGIVSFATTAWWLGLLPSMGIGMAITLVIPTIFIISLGTDYTVHLIWSFLKVGNVREVFLTTGKSILFSWMTTVGPFLIFIGIQDLSVRKTMLATALAITIIFVVTMMVVPVFYPVGPKSASARRSAGAVPAAATAAPPSSRPAPPAPMVALKRPKPASTAPTPAMVAIKRPKTAAVRRSSKSK